jgi:ferredoxin
MITLRRVRTTLAIAVLLLIATVFVGIPHGLFLTDIQLIPAFLNGSLLLGFASAGFLLIVLLTLTLGRVYCSVICPLGILQDLLRRLLRRGRARHRYAPQPPRHAMRWAVLALVSAPLLFGSAAAIGLLDPYSLFGRMLNSLVRPTLQELNNLATVALRAAGWPALIPVKVAWPPLWSLTLTLGMLLLLVWLVRRNGRVFCNSLCPAGTFLSLLARCSVWQLQIANPVCLDCGACGRVCKTGCIDRASRTIDFSRCVVCGNCMDICPQAGIGYALNPFWRRLGERLRAAVPAVARRRATRTRDSRRRRFLRATVLAGGSALTGAAALPGSATPPRYEDKLTPVIPPGAGELTRFQALCTACQLCVNHCHTHALRPGFLELGWRGIQQPVFDFRRGFCDFTCTTCTTICPTGALQPLDLARKRRTRIGVARFFSEHCVVKSKGNECGACLEHCPTMAVVAKPFRADRPNLLLPEVLEAYCIGCGICEHACPVRPAAIRVEGLRQHTLADIKESKPMQTIPALDDGFPF